MLRQAGSCLSSQTLCLMKPYDQPIFTLNARDNVMLEVMRDYFNLTSDVMNRPGF